MLWLSIENGLNLPSRKLFLNSFSTGRLAQKLPQQLGFRIPSRNCLNFYSTNRLFVKNYPRNLYNKKLLNRYAFLFMITTNVFIVGNHVIAHADSKASNKNLGHRPLTNRQKNNLSEAVNSFQMGNIKSAVQELIRLSAERPELTEILVLLEAEKFSQAEKLAEKIAHSNGLESQFNLVKGIILHCLNKNKLADECFNQIIATNSSPFIVASAYFHKGLLRVGTSADLLFKKATSLVPDIDTLIGDYANIKKTVHQYNYQNISKNEQLALRSECKIVIRIWHPEPGTKDVGHVSLQTFHGGESNTGIYASFWPASSPEVGSRLKTFPGELKKDPLADIDAEKRLPDERIVLYTLDVPKINKAFIDFKKSSFNWQLLGNTFFSSTNQNCSGLTAYLLQQGGIDQYYEPWANIKQGVLIGGSVGFIVGFLYALYDSIMELLTKIQSSSHIRPTIGIQPSSGGGFLTLIIALIVVICTHPYSVITSTVIGALAGLICGATRLIETQTVSPANLHKRVKWVYEKEKDKISSNIHILNNSIKALKDTSNNSQALGFNLRPS